MCLTGDAIWIIENANEKQTNTTKECGFATSVCRVQFVKKREGRLLFWLCARVPLVLPVSTCHPLMLITSQLQIKQYIPYTSMTIDCLAHFDSPPSNVCLFAVVYLFPDCSLRESEPRYWLGPLMAISASLVDWINQVFRLWLCWPSYSMGIYEEKMSKSTIWWVTPINYPFVAYRVVASPYLPLHICMYVVCTYISTRKVCLSRLEPPSPALRVNSFRSWRYMGKSPTCAFWLHLIEDPIHHRSLELAFLESNWMKRNRANLVYIAFRHATTNIRLVQEYE